MTNNQAPELTPISPEQSKNARIIRELQELTDDNTNNDMIDLANNKLNDEFGDYLVSNPTDLRTLTSVINSIDETQLQKDVLKSFSKIKKFVEKLSNKMEESYDDFIKKLNEKPNKLGKIDDDDINRIKAYLKFKGREKSKEDENITIALNTYRTINTKIKNNILKREDIENINVLKTVWNTLKETHGRDEDFLNEDFPELDSTKNSLKEFAGNNWNGEDFTENSDLNGKFDANNTIIDKSFLILKLNTLNSKRRDRIKTNVVKDLFKDNNGIFKKDIFDDNNGDFLRDNFIKSADGKTLKIKVGENYVDFNIEDYTNDINNCINSEQDVINETEATRLMGELKGEINDIFQNLLTDDNILTEKPANPEDTPENTAIDSKLCGISETDFTNIEKYFQSLGEDNMFLFKKTNIDSHKESYEYNSEKAKQFLGSLKSTARNELKTSIGKRRAVVAAVQIILNEKAESDSEKIKIDGKFGKETRDRVTVFQTKYNDNIPEGSTKIKADGLPGKDTITVLLDEKIGDTVREGEWHIDGNGEIAFDNQNEILEETENNITYKYIQIGNDKYYENNSKGTGKGYEYGINDEHLGYLYIGNYQGGKRHGRGTMTWANGDNYDGDWENNQRTGEGTYTWANGNKFEGNWKNGERNGNGTFTWIDDGTKFEGDWVNNDKTRGTITWANGNKFEGNWENDERTKGTFIVNPGDNEVRYEVDKVDGKSVIISGPEGDNNIGKYVYRGEIVDEWPNS